MLLYAPQVDIQAGIAAQGGRIQAGNVLRQVNDRGVIEDVLVRPATGKPAGVTLAAGATLDVSGLWTNAALDPAASPGLARRNGGQVALRSSGSIALGQGSLVDVSGGAAIQSGGKALAGRGGDLLLEAGSAGSPGVLALDGALAARGVDGGGKLTLQANQIRVVRAEQRARPRPPACRCWRTATSRRASQYELIGTRGLEVVEGAQLRVSMPLLRLAPDAAAATDKTRALQAWTPPLYQEDAVKSVLTQRKGASLTLQSGTLQTAQNELSRVGLTLAEGSLVAVDPGQRINLAGIGQITLNGTLQAWSGRIAVTARDHGRDDGDRLRPLALGRRTRRAGRGRAPRRSTSRASPTACCRMAAASRWAAWSTSPRATWPRRTCSSCCGRAAGWTHPAPPPACWPTARRWPPPAPAG